MEIKKHFSFKGRISRMNYFLYQVIVGIPVGILNVILNRNLNNLILVITLSIILLLLNIILFTKAIQRLHDTNTTGLLILIPIVIGLIDNFTNTYNFSVFPFVFYILVLVVRGSKGPNKYGEEPLE